MECKRPTIDKTTFKMKNKVEAYYFFTLRLIIKLDKVIKIMWSGYTERHINQ